MSSSLDFVSWQGVLTPGPSIALPHPEEALTLAEEIAVRYTKGQIATSHMSSGVWEVFEHRLDVEEEKILTEVTPYEVCLSAHQPREDPRKRYIRAPGRNKPSHYEILSHLGQAAFVPWRTLFALIDSDTASHGELWGNHGPTVGLYLKTKIGGIMKVSIMRTEAQGKFIYYMDNPIVPDAIRAGPLEYGVKTIFAQARTQNGLS